MVVREVSSVNLVSDWDKDTALGYTPGDELRTSNCVEKLG